MDNIEQILVEAKEVLQKMDKAIDGLETEFHIKSTHDLTQLLLEWNLLGQNFVSLGIQDYIKLE